MRIGVFCSSNKPHLWDSLYKTLSANDVDWSLCIAGPNPPIEPLPGNVKYIQTNVKPAQCFFIAEQNTTSDLVSMMSDDTLLSPGCLDNLSKIVNNKMIIASTKYARGSPYLFRQKGRYITLSFPFPTVATMHRETFDEVGIDKNYVAMFWDLDLAFELVLRGRKVVISDVSFSSDEKGVNRLCKGFGDYGYLLDMWTCGKKVRDKRKELIDSFVYTPDILEVSQGRKNPRWV